MSGVRWTPAQQDAISAEGGSLLVSAAAGSGKTAVLVQRVTDMLTRPVNPVPADKLLIVTFTNAAAAEMRGRLASRLADLLKEQPDNTLLARQQLLLESAHISTIHSFCGELLRENFEKLDVSQNFSIADTDEIKLLRRQAMDNVMSRLYDEGDRSFYRLADYFSPGRNDNGLRETIIRLFDFTSSHPFPESWFEEKLTYYNDSSPWNRVVKDHCLAAFNYCLGLLGTAIPASEDDPKLQKAFQPFLITLQEMLEDAGKLELSDLFALLDKIVFPRLNTPRGYKENELYIYLSAVRKEVKETLEEVREMLAELFATDISQAAHELYPIIEKLFGCVTAFRDEFSRLKLQRNTLDFSDLEHLTIRLLTQKTSSGWKKTDVANEYALRFHEIMVDEYQDVNEAQGLIFSALSQDENNLFMVGDVKQSIYRFRHARPELFLARRAAYHKYTRENESFPAVITLDRNFRSSKGVLDFTNFVFRQVMSEQMGDVDYSGGEELVHGGKDTPPPGASLYVVDCTGEKYDESNDVIEARCIAELIGERIADGTAESFADFSILLRSCTGHASIYAEHLNACGIPAVAVSEEGFLSTPEVSAVVSLLRVIDNPMQDVPLLAVMLSPIFNFTVDDVALIRAASPKTSLYDAVKNSFPDFLNRLSEIRALSPTMPTDRFIRYLYKVTDWENIVRSMPDSGAQSAGETRLANLRYFVRCAKKYSGMGYESLSDFLGFLDKLEEAGEDILPITLNSDRLGAVQIMTIHKSKGLEFPFCIVAGCSRRFNTDSRGDLLLHPSYGAGMLTEDGEATLGHTAVGIALRRDEISEQLRVLYVAMTRAQQELIMVTTCKDAEKTLSKLALSIPSGERMLPFTVGKANNFASWLLTAALRHPGGGPPRTLSGVSPEIVLPSKEELRVHIVKAARDFPENCVNPHTQDIPHIQQDNFTIPEALTYCYPYEEDTRIPVRAGVSAIAQRETSEQMKFTSKPAFLMEGAILSREKGIAMHRFLQYANYTAEPKQEIKRLLRLGLLTRKQAEQITPSQIDSFFGSKLGQRIKNADQVLREYRFTIDNAPTILQGAVDCILVEKGEITVIDYKTDRTDNINILAERYAKQLQLYAAAVSECLGLPIKECIIYSFYLEKYIGVHHETV